MQTELNKLIIGDLEASFLIADNLNKALNEVSKEFGLKIENEFRSQGFTCNYEVNFSKKYSGFWIQKSDWKKIEIGFEFQSSDRDLIYGFRILKSYTNDAISLDLINKLRLLPNNTKSGTNTWPWFKYIDQPYNDWRKLDTWQAISDGTLEKSIEEKVELLLKLTEGMEL